MNIKITYSFNLTAGVTPPESHPRENIVVVQLADGSTVNLCANSEDESMQVFSHPLVSAQPPFITVHQFLFTFHFFARAWKLTLLETKRNPVSDPCCQFVLSRIWHLHSGTQDSCFLSLLQVFTYDPYDDSYQAIPINGYQTVYITPGAGPGMYSD